MNQFDSEKAFENALIEALSTRYGWEAEVLNHPTEEDLLKNWADILFTCNNTRDRLNQCPLTDGEMQQILEQIRLLRTPMRLNGFINGKTVSIQRDNPDDKLHFGKEISLKIYDRHEIAAGQSRYQIARQPQFRTRSILNDRRGDVMLLINGMPLIHLELKMNGVPVINACNQIERYAGEGVFTGLFSLVQIFVAMEPNETLYFANPGPDGKFNKDFYFHWGDFNNEPINDWKVIAEKLLSIPMAHQLIGFYTIPDASDGVLKVLRSYQFHAVYRISDYISKINLSHSWGKSNQLGGYIWHTTGSGKTVTSFKAAQLIANSNDADKVVFLMDRIELGTQSAINYRNFAEENESVQETEDTTALIAKLKSSDPANTLIVTSIQKMAILCSKENTGNQYDIQLINQKRLVLIIDEAHRSTFGEPLQDIKDAFPAAVFFGFTGTPILDENQKKLSTTATIFGNELHRYSIADGIRDHNVLGFDPYKVLTYRDKDLRQAVGLHEVKARTLEEVFADPKKKEKFQKFQHMEMTEIETYVPSSQYDRDEHRKIVVRDIGEQWLTLSQNSKFHAILATSSIPEAIEYYRLIKKKFPELKVTALFDPNIDNSGGVKFKEDGLEEILLDYNARYGQNFTLASHGRFKKDISLRLAHKGPYIRVEYEPEKKLDLLIVVDQMLTGFDSKWVNTLYLDKLLRYENIIQAFSRTNRLFGPDKPFGTIRYYRFPHTMEAYIQKAVKLYSGDQPLGLFAMRLPENIQKMNELFREIRQVFTSAGIQNFERLPDDDSECAQFAKLFSKFNQHLEAAKIQGFHWDEPAGLELDEQTYITLLMRYKELATGSIPGDGELPFEIDGYLTEIDTARIDENYMNSRFEKYLKALNSGDAHVQERLEDLHKSFAVMSQEDQTYAKLFIHDVESGDIIPDPTQTFTDYVAKYRFNAKSRQIKSFVETFGLDEAKLRALMNLAVHRETLNEFGRFDDLKNTADKNLMKTYFDRLDGHSVPPFQVNIRFQDLLMRFIMEGGFELD